MAASKKDKRKKWVIVLLVLYLVVLFYLLFFAEQMGRSGGAEYRYNMVPFKEIKRFVLNARTLGIRAVVLNVLGNIVVFIPLGYFIPRVLKDNPGAIVSVLLCMEFSLAVELVQLISKKGCCDVDDVILNTLGGLMGYIVYYFLRRRKRKKC